MTWLCLALQRVSFVQDNPGRRPVSCVLTQPLERSPVTCLTILAALVLSTQPLTPDDIGDRIRPLVDEAMASGASPGLQVAVVFADGRRWSEGFGIADLDSMRPVDETTPFYLASTTKALTALAAATLHERGELDLDATLREALPDATFPDAARADEVTVRDLLTHTHGLRHQGLSWRVAFTGEYTNDLFVESLADVQAGSTRFRYTNFGYDIIGVILDREHTGGWKAIVHAEVIEPIGMTHTSATPSTFGDDVLAMPHDLGPEGMQRIRLTKRDANMGPAGGHFSTAADLARLLLIELNQGAIDGHQVFEPQVIAETQQPQVSQDRTFIHYDRHAWGLGWDIGTYDGDLVIHRPGGFAGYYANAAFMPEHAFGVVVLANGGSASARLAEIVAGAIYDELRDRPDAQERLASRIADLRESVRRRQAALRDIEQPAMAPEPVRPWADYAGQYVNETWGTITIERTSNGLRAIMGPMADDLRPLAEQHCFNTRLFGEEDIAVIRIENNKAILTFRGEPDQYIRR